jgi:hypothetical protein
MPIFARHLLTDDARCPVNREGGISPESAQPVIRNWCGDHQSTACLLQTHLPSSKSQSVRGIQAIRLFNGERERHSVWMNLLAEQMNADLRVSKLSISSQTANTLLLGRSRRRSTRLAQAIIDDDLTRDPQQPLFYPFSTRDTSGYRSHMNSTNARTFGAGRRLDVCKTHSSTSTPETVPH